MTTSFDQLLLDRTNDTLSALFAEFIPEACDADDLIDDATHLVAALIDSAMRPALLAHLRAKFEAEGGRGVHLAEEIDRLEHQRTLIVTIPVVITDPHDEPEAVDMTRALLDNLGDDWWTTESGCTDFGFEDGPTDEHADPDSAVTMYGAGRRTAGLLA